MRFTYDAAGRITSWTDRNANTYCYTYDATGRVVRTEGSGGYLSGTLSYDKRTRTTTVTNGLGHSTRYEHNEAFRLIRKTDPLGHTTQQEWDSHGRLIAVTDPLGHTTDYRYDTHGRMVSVVAADGLTSMAEYNDRGLPVAITGPDSGVWSQEYDEHGNRTEVTDPAGATTRYSYTPSGCVDAISNTSGDCLHIRSNSAGLPTKFTDALGAVTSYEYDALGRHIAVIDPLGNASRLEWTVEGRLVRRTAPDGSHDSWTYDEEGNCTSHTDPLGGVTRYQYTDFDLLSARTGPDGARYTFTHDTELRLTQVTNPHGLTWSYAYDPAGRLTSETDFDDRTVTYTYDAAGRFLSRTTPLGRTITHTLDAAGRVLTKDADGERTTYAYDLAGHLISAASASSTLVLERDTVGRVLSEEVDGSLTRFTYDALGRRATRTTPNGAITRYVRDRSGNPTALSMGGHTLTFTRDPLGRETSRSFGQSHSPVTLSGTWDRLGRQTTQHLATSSSTLRSRAYEYRADSSLTLVVDKVSGEQRRISLDPAGRPLAITAAGWSESYAYDQAGNQTRADWPEAAPHSEARGERTYLGTRIRSAGTVRYEYDAAGRTILRQKPRLSRKPDTWRYVYDVEDRLTSCTTPDGTVWTYSYDPLGRRTAKHRMASNGDMLHESVHFSWDGTHLAEQYDTATGIASTWDYDDDHPVAQLERKLTESALSRGAENQDAINARFFAIVTDLVGTPTELVDEEGRISWHTRTTLWGTTTWNRNATAYTPLRYPGQYADPETGLHYNFFRHYDPDTARYTTPDPLGLAPAPNPLAYTHNPLTWSDPLGLVPKACKSDRYTWDGSVRFGALDSLDRPTGIWAALRDEMRDTGTEAGTTTTPGWRGQGSIFNEARGHLLANRLGGPGKGSLSRQNLVTLTQDPVNTPVMKGIETKVYNAIKAGEVVQYSVKPIYGGANPVPLRLEISAHGNRGFTLNEVLENPASGVRTGTIPVIP